jgi:hypothetical protein
MPSSSDDDWGGSDGESSQPPPPKRPKTTAAQRKKQSAPQLTPAQQREKDEAERIKSALLKGGHFTSQLKMVPASAVCPAGALVGGGCGVPACRRWRCAGVCSLSFSLPLCVHRARVSLTLGRNRRRHYRRPR